MRIMMLSNAPWAPSGYGQQSRIFLPRLADLGHEMAVTCFYGLEGGTINMGKFICFPRAGHLYGNDIIAQHTLHFGADIMMSLMDTWVMNPDEYPKSMRWVPWYPVDHEPLPNIIRAKISLAYRRITFSKFGVKMTHEAGLDCTYIPHGIETDIFKPMDKKKCREFLGLPQDKYIVGTVAMNKGNYPSRKCLVEMLEAFTEFHKRHPDSAYLMQTSRGEGDPQMINIPELLKFLGLVEGVDVLFPDQYQLYMGYPVDFMAQLYNAMDVHLITTRGEGFGIPTLEAQACGVPVICGGWTATRELFFTGQMLDPIEDAEREYTGLASYNYRPHVGAIIDAMEEEFNHPSDGSIGVEKAKEYDADLITQKYWKPVLAEIEEGLK